MTREEFTKAIVYLSAGCQKMLKPEEASVYYDLLKDLDETDFMAGVRSVLMTHVWHTFPSVAELRHATVAIANSRYPHLTSGEAWALAWDAAAKIDPDLNGPHRIYIGNGEYREFNSQAESVLNYLPAPVVKAMKTYGLRELCAAAGPDGVIRSQFTKIYEQQAERDQRTALMPPSVRKVIEEKRDEDLVKKSLASIGDMPK